ncbi:MAG: hypothetical protein JW863_19065 [Chitinispirillaceae bacterium]|nr:hypothetical protein [Chitinispirillaceae bacterium]
MIPLRPILFLYSMIQNVSLLLRGKPACSPSGEISGSRAAAACLPAVVIMLAAITGYAQTNLWPGDLNVPEAEENAETGDNAGSSVSLLSTTSMYQTFKTRNRLDWQRRFKEGTLTQIADYGLEQVSSRSSIQYTDFTGMLIYSDVLTSGLDAGIDWSPVLSYRKFPSGGILESNADIGPVVKHTLFSVPYTVRGGLYGYGWSDTVQSLRAVSQGVLHGNPGVYGSVSVGNPRSTINDIPLYVGINADGRSLDGSNLGLMTASARHCRVLPHLGDSLFFHMGDSLTNGKELYLGEYEGKSFYSNTSWRINHSFSGAAGVKMVQRFGIAPRLYYRYYLNSIAYPENAASLDDQMRTGNQFGVMATTDSLRRLSYSGGIVFGREFENWLFRRDFSTGTALSAADSMAMIINQSDHHSTLVRTGNRVKIALPWGMSATYHLNASKDSKQYDKTLDGKFNRNEFDRVQINNALSLRYERDTLNFFELYGQYGKIYHYYFSEKQSAESKMINEYRLGIDMGLSAGPFTIRENIYSDAEVSEMRYAVNLPPYARDVNSTLSGKMILMENRLQITGKWVEMYHDDGYWYGRDYWTDTPSVDHEFYAIEQKNTQYWLDFALESLWERGKLTVGTLLHDVFQRHWKRDQNTGEAEYVVSELDMGYNIEPYCTFKWQSSRFLLSTRLRRIIRTRDEYRFSLDKNWDFLLSLQMVF